MGGQLKCFFSLTSFSLSVRAKVLMYYRQYTNNDMDSFSSKVDSLNEYLRSHAPLVIALSGGTDSQTLLAFAKKADIDVTAVCVDTGLQSAEELRAAETFAQEHEIPYTILSSDFFAVPEIVRNLPDRCYHCKHHMMTLITEWATEHGYSYVADGTHADDDPTLRPGMKALKELRILSPFAECDIGRDTILKLAERLHVTIRPPSSCLATRVPTNMKLTPSILQNIENAESLLQKQLSGKIRVRVLTGSGAQAEIETEDPKIFLRNDCIELVKKCGFDTVAVRHLRGS